jgi:hypothetical protein
MLRRVGCVALTVGVICTIDFVGAFGFGGSALEVAQPLCGGPSERSMEPSAAG